jgi:hypothetical protein
MSSATTATTTISPTLPAPPLTYYPPPPEEPVWRDQRQRHHVSSLHEYIGELFVWTELCRSEMLFRKKMGLPVAKQDVWDVFLSESLTHIREWIETLRQWTEGQDAEQR